jgi:hypothetical protein
LFAMLDELEAEEKLLRAKLNKPWPPSSSR